MSPVREAVWLGIALTLLGWVWGSFINQLVDRTAHRNSEKIGGNGGAPQPVTQPISQPVTLLRPPRSICFACGVGIPWYENIPVFSYLLLRGACRRCGAPIGRRTLSMEVAVPVVITGLYWLRAGRGEFLWREPWPTALEFMLSSLLLSWLLLIAALLAERRRLGNMLLVGAALALAWLFLSMRN